MKALLALLIISTICFAQKLIVNRDHSEINFDINYLKISKVSGKFEHFQGVLELDTGNVKRIKLIIDSSSVDTGNGPRDGHLKDKDFLYSKKFPSIIFESSQIKKNGKKYLAKGILTFREKKLNREVEFTLQGPVKDTWNNKSWFLKLKHSISREALGITWNKTLSGEDLILGDNIHFNSWLQLQKPSEKTAGSKYKTADNESLRFREKIFRGEVKKPVANEKAPVIDIKMKSGIMKIPVPKPIIAKEQKEKIKEIEYSPWISFMLLSFFGFVGVIGLAITLKKHDKLYIWSEEKLWKNFVFDLFLYAIISLYAWACFELMPM